MAGPLLISHPACLGHQAPGHPEAPARLEAIEAGIEADADLRTLTRSRPIPARESDLLRVHTERHVAGLLGAAAGDSPRGGWLDPDTWIGPGSLEAALAAAGGAMAAADAALAGEGTAFSLCRPPGHHSTASRAMGFCLFNNVAVGAAHAISRGAERVAIVDFDVHHGNGTQDIFYSRSDVLYLSCHQSPLYPGTGAAQDRGRGDGEGFTVNAPMAAGGRLPEYEEVFGLVFEPAILDFHPDLILVSAGFDAHRDDPLAGMSLTSADFGVLSGSLRGLAERACQGRIAWVLEGGYNLRALSESVTSCLNALNW
ncbi:MAG: histone deacetylase family protein [Candidatus Dormibacteria bacterium]